MSEEEVRPAQSESTESTEVHDPHKVAKELKARARRLYRRIFWMGSGGVAALVLLAIIALCVWICSPSFENLIRGRLVSKLHNATGGRVTLRAFHWHPFQLQAEVQGLTIRGNEAQFEEPYLQIEALDARFSVLGLWSPRLRLRELVIHQPSAHLIVYADGSTNQPQPRKQGKAGKPGLDRLFDLQAGHLAIEQGVLHYEDRAAAFDFQNRKSPLSIEAKDVSLGLIYQSATAIAPEKYLVEWNADNLELRRTLTGKKHPAVQGRTHLMLELTRNAASLRSLRITSYGSGIPARELEINGQLLDFAHPRWQGHAFGDLDLRLVEPLTGYPDAPVGLAHLDISAAGGAGVFRADGTVHVDGASYVGVGLAAKDVRLDARVHADPEQLRISSILVHLRDGGMMEGDVSLLHWIQPLPGEATMQPASAANNKEKSKHKAVKAVVPPEDRIDIPVDGTVSARFRNVSMDALLEIVSVPPFLHIGFDTRLNGPANARWIHGDVKTLEVGAQLSMTAPAQTLAGKVPANGAIDAVYSHSNGSVQLKQLDLRLPSSRIEAHGQLGAYPMTSASALNVEFHSGNLSEFDTLLRELGMQANGRSGASALPVALHGQSEFHGTWNGSLLDPHLSGAARATQLSVELPPSAWDAEKKARWLSWDWVEASGSYSAEKITIEHAQLHQGQSSLDVSGSLAAAPPLRKSQLPTLDGNAQLRAHVKIDKLSVDRLQMFTPKKLPFTGVLNAQLALDGALQNLDNSGWAEIVGGTLYQEPLQRLRVQGNLHGQALQLRSVTLETGAGNIFASGSYALDTGYFKGQAKTTDLNLARISRLQEKGIDADGALSATVSGDGTFDDPRIEAGVMLANLSIRGQQLGFVELHAQAANREAHYEVHTRLDAAEVALCGQTSLQGNHMTHAQLDVTHFDIGAMLKLLKIQGLNGESSLAGNAVLDGPLDAPQQLHGEAHLRELAANVNGVHLHSEGEVHAVYADSVLTLDPLHIMGEDTDLHVQGSLALKEQNLLDLAARGSINMKVAQTLDPDLSASGSTTFEVRAHGPLQNPDLQGRVNMQNVSLALQDWPNSLSQLRGTLEFNQNRLEVRSMTAMTGGGQLSLGGYLEYKHGLYADLTATGQGVRIRYPEGISSIADATLHLQGPSNNLLLNGGVLIKRFSVSPDLDIAALAAPSSNAKPLASPDAPSNHIRLDVHLSSTPQLNFQNSYAKLAGDVDLRLRGTVASPSLLGRISVTEGNAIIAGTRYELQRGDLNFTNPVHIQPLIDLNATARVEDYDITLGLHGTLDKPLVSYRSDPPLPEADVVALLALGRTQDQQRLYTQQQMQTVANPTTDALLGGALNATVSSRVQKLFGAGSVKVDPNYLGALGNSTSRIIVEEQLSRYVTLTYATNVNTTSQQLIQAEVAVNRHVSLVVARDESGVFSMVLKATRRYK